MKQKICHIICAGAGKILPKKVGEKDIILVADGGYEKIKNSTLKANLVIGDFDSYKGEPPNEITLKLPVEKDDTDTFYCVKEGINRGYDTFYFYCATGGSRFDHTYANLQILTFLANCKKQGYVFSGRQVITAIKNTCLNFDKKASGFISVFSVNEKAQGVEISGLKYEFLGDLKNDFALAVSNEFCKKSAKISVQNGCLLVVFDKKNLNCLNNKSGAIS